MKVQKKASIEEFDPSQLKHVEVKEKSVLPTVADIYCELLPEDLTEKSELKGIKNFVRSKLRHVHSEDYSFVPTLDMIKQEEILCHSDVKNFNKSKLRHVQTKETSMVPSMANLRAELIPDFLPTRPELHKLQMFVRSYLRHVQTKEKNPLPTFEEIQQESKDTFAEVKNFNRSKLHRSNTVEKNTLPGMDTLWEEIMPDELPTKPELKELVKFAYSDLKHVEPNIDYHLPTAKEIEEESLNTNAAVKNFNRGKLKRANTNESSFVPTPGVLRAELMPDYLPPKSELDALKKFVRSTLKHVETFEKVFKPTAKDLLEERAKGSRSQSTSTNR